MSVNTVTYDQVPPIRPGVDDMGGAAKQNARRPPDPQRSVTAEDINQWTKQLVELAAASPTHRVSIKYTAGVPSVDFATGLGSAAKNVGTYTIVDNGVGDCSITWAVGTFPGRTAYPFAGVSSATPGVATPELISNGVRVRVFNLANPPAAADLNFVVTVFGQ